MNSVHPRHTPEWFFERKRHFIFAFHDSTFECVAESFEVEVRRGSRNTVLALMLEEFAAGRANQAP